jgi:hypothetical protein
MLFPWNSRFSVLTAARRLDGRRCTFRSPSTALNWNIISILWISMTPTIQQSHDFRPEVALLIRQARATHRTFYNDIDFTMYITCRADDARYWSIRLVTEALRFRCTLTYSCHWPIRENWNWEYDAITHLFATPDVKPHKISCDAQGQPRHYSPHASAHRDYESH